MVTSLLLSSLDSEDCNIEDDEENVIDDSEEQSIFVMNPTDFIKSKALFQKAQEEIQTYANKRKFNFFSFILV